MTGEHPQGDDPDSLNASWSVEILAFPIGRCGKGAAKGTPCNRPAAYAHVRSDQHPPLILWVCSQCHDEAAQAAAPTERLEPSEPK